MPFKYHIFKYTLLLPVPWEVVKIKLKLAQYISSCGGREIVTCGRLVTAQSRLLSTQIISSSHSYKFLFIVLGIGTSLRKKWPFKILASEVWIKKESLI